MTAALRVADVIRSCWEAYNRANRLPPHVVTALRHILACRTAELGGHLHECDQCGSQVPMYNSCQDRHCPKCQWAEQYEWVADRMAELPGAKYHHTVFTVPDNQLHDVMMMNKKVMYQIIFKAAADTLKTFAADPKHLGATIGMIGMLHTWGETLNYHVHVHFLVTAGGLSPDGQRWITSKYGDKFLFPVRAMSMVFKGKFIALLKDAFKNGELVLTGKLKGIAQPEAFACYIKGLARHMFRIHSKPATQKPKNVVKYLGSYMNRAAISNSRIEGMEAGKIVFRYRDNRDKGKLKRCRMDPQEFIRRYLTHILPKGFVRVRYFGIFAGNDRREKLAKARALLGSLEGEPTSEPIPAPSCKMCGKGSLQVIEYIREPVSMLWIFLLTVSRNIIKYEDTS
jgi:hypothetical protein